MLLPALGCGAGSSPSELIVFHAGSLATPFKQIAEAFGKRHPETTILLESAGSLTNARKITDLGRECDVLAVADYRIIDDLLIPQYADWTIHFADNEIVVAYGGGSRRSEELNADNWYEILLDEEVRFGRSDPASDPGGYRSIFVVKLAEAYYEAPGLAEKLLAKNREYIRPKSTDLLALLETGNIDYAILYRSVATQHGLSSLILPDALNLRNPDYADCYATVSTELPGRDPGSSVTKRGEPIVYGITIPKVAPNPAVADVFVAFLLEEGLAIMEQNGQTPLVPSPTESYDKIPQSLKAYAAQATVSR
jgi:molybdate/tungstate transport system substrate-binding protein